jgi:hypothetical protein
MVFFTARSYLMPDRKILEITALFGTFKNLPFPHPDNEHWTTDLFQNKTFLTNDSPVWEWTPLLDQQDEFDTKLVGVAGTAIYPKKGAISDTDNPLYHPFDFDFEFFIAPDPQYVSLLAPNNRSTGKGLHPDYAEAINKANESNGLNLGVPGVLGLETDQGLVPIGANLGKQTRTKGGERRRQAVSWYR